MAAPTLGRASAGDETGSQPEARGGHGSVQTFTIDVSRGDARETVVVRGELDIATVPLLQAVLDTAHRRRPRRVEVDLSGVRFIDACAAGCLLDAHQRLAARGAELVLRDSSPVVRRVLALAGLEEVLTG